jgi:dienelactone hydrolase
VAAVVALVVAVGVVAFKNIKGGGDVPAVAANGPDAPFVIDQTTQPNFPELGNPIQQLPGGTSVHFVDFSSIQQPNAGPGTRMKMRVYIPPGDHQPASIPCVLVAPAGTNMLVGNDMDASDYHDETLPYAQAGMAVAFYSIDGGVGDMEKASDAQFIAGYNKFRAAGAGVVNGRNALEFILAKVPQVDPQRIYTAGHSSAGTLSLLLAEHEPRIRACIAYAPCSDVEKRLAEVTGNWALRRSLPGLLDFVKQSSPKTHVANFQCPVFLFHALDDGNVPAGDSSAFASLMKASAKQVTYRTVPFGNHYQSMIDAGIPQAIAWLQQSQGANPSTQPSPAGSPPSAAAPNASFPPTTITSNRPTQPKTQFPNPTLPGPMPRVPAGPDPSKLFPPTPALPAGVPSGGRVVTFSVLAYTGNEDGTAAARKALAGVSWAKVNEVTYDEQSKTIVVPMRGSSLNTGPARLSLQKAGFKIGFTRVMSGPRPR